MQWSNDRARIEYEWLRLISKFKYDGYRDFVAGVQFLESLITWLTQFETSEERQTAYDFLKDRLVYVSPAELTKLIDLCYFEHIRPMVTQVAANDLAVDRYRLWSHPNGSKRFDYCFRHVLFMGLSDGARTDLLRYAARGKLKNEQVVSFTQIDPDKWQDLLDCLRNDTNDRNARFHCLFVIDDFTASGTSILRRPGLEKEWKGKLVRLWNSLDYARRELQIELMQENWSLRVHHYLATQQARCTLLKRKQQAAHEREHNWFKNLEFSFSSIFDSSIKVTDQTDHRFLLLTEKHYDPNIESKQHLEECEIDNLKRGYAECSLPLVLEHNTPNNSLALLWAESSKGAKIAMRPLFRRHQRHI